jgi:hypothetical protein
MTVEKPDQWDAGSAGIVLRRKTRNKVSPNPTLPGPQNRLPPSESDDAMALARRVTRRPSPPAKFVSALWQQRGQLRFAIQCTAYSRTSVADLQGRARALGQAAKRIRRAVDGVKTSHKSNADQIDQLRWSINDLRPLFRTGGAASSGSIAPSPSEIFNYLYEATPIDRIPAFLRCDDDEMSECLNVIERAARDGRFNELRTEAFPNRVNFIASLEVLEKLAEARLSSKLINKRMKPISAETSAARKYLSNRKLHRLLQSERWSAKLLCAVTILVAEQVWPEFLTAKEEACEELWNADGGTPHKGVDEIYDEWSQKWLRAAREAGRDIQQDLAGVFFDEPFIPSKARGHWYNEPPAN